MRDLANGQGASRGNLHPSPSLIPRQARDEGRGPRPRARLIALGAAVRVSGHERNGDGGRHPASHGHGDKKNQQILHGPQTRRPPSTLRRPKAPDRRRCQAKLWRSQSKCAVSAVTLTVAHLPRQMVIGRSTNDWLTGRAMDLATSPAMALDNPDLQRSIEAGWTTLGLAGLRGRVAPGESPAAGLVSTERPQSRPMAGGSSLAQIF